MPKNMHTNRWRISIAFECHSNGCERARVCPREPLYHIKCLLIDTTAALPIFKRTQNACVSHNQQLRACGFAVSFGKCCTSCRRRTYATHTHTHILFTTTAIAKRSIAAGVACRHWVQLQCAYSHGGNSIECYKIDASNSIKCEINQIIYTSAMWVNLIHARGIHLGTWRFCICIIIHHSWQMFHHTTAEFCVFEIEQTNLYLVFVWIA